MKRVLYAYRINELNLGETRFLVTEQTHALHDDDQSFYNSVLFLFFLRRFKSIPSGKHSIGRKHASRVRSERIHDPEGRRDIAVSKVEVNNNDSII